MHRVTPASSYRGLGQGHEHWLTAGQGWLQFMQFTFDLLGSRGTRFRPLNVLSDGCHLVLRLANSAQSKLSLVVLYHEAVFPPE